MKIKIKESKKYGRGVFATDNIIFGEVIEISDLIILSKLEAEHIDKTSLYNYYFSWNEDIAIALGYGSLYNHSYQPNAVYIKKISERCLEFVALKDIKKGEEIFVNYNENPNDKSELWFETK